MDVADKTGIKEERLIAFLSAQAVSEAKAGETPWLIRYWLEMLLMLIGLVVIVYAAYGIVLVVRAVG